MTDFALKEGALFLGLKPLFALLSASLAADDAMNAKVARSRKMDTLERTVLIVHALELERSNCGHNMFVKSLMHMPAPDRNSQSVAQQQTNPRITSLFNSPFFILENRYRKCKYLPTLQRPQNHRYRSSPYEKGNNICT